MTEPRIRAKLGIVFTGSAETYYEYVCISWTDENVDDKDIESQAIALYLKEYEEAGDDSTVAHVFLAHWEWDDDVNDDFDERIERIDPNEEY